MHFETQSCHIVSLDREYLLLVASGCFFQYSYLYTALITFFFSGGGGGVGEAGCFGGKLLPLKYPRYNSGNVLFLSSEVEPEFLAEFLGFSRVLIV